MKFPIFSDRRIVFSEVTNSPFFRASYSSPDCTNMKIIAPCKGYIYMVYHPNIIDGQPRTWCLVFKPDSSEGIHRIPEWAIPEFNEMLFVVEEFSSDSREPYSNAYIARQALGLYRDRMAINGSTEAITIPIYERNTAGTLHRSTRTTITLAQDGSNIAEVASNFATTYWNNSRIFYLPVEANQVIANFTNNFTSKKIEVAVWWMDDTRRPLRDGQCYIFDTHRYFQILKSTGNLQFAEHFNNSYSPFRNLSREQVIASLIDNPFSIKCKILHSGGGYLNNIIQIKNFTQKIEIELSLQIRNSNPLLDPVIPANIFRVFLPFQEESTPLLEISSRYTNYRYRCQGVNLNNSNVASIYFNSIIPPPIQGTNITLRVYQENNPDPNTITNKDIIIQTNMDYVGSAMDIVYELYSLKNRFNEFKRQTNAWAGANYSNIRNEEIIILFEQIKNLYHPDNGEVYEILHDNLNQRNGYIWHDINDKIYGQPNGFKYRTTLLFQRLLTKLNDVGYYEQIQNDPTQYNLDIHHWVVTACYYFEEGEELMNVITSNFFGDDSSRNIVYLKDILKRLHGNAAETVIKTISLLLTHQAKRNLINTLFTSRTVDFQSKLEELVAFYNEKFRGNLPFRFTIQGGASLTPIQERIRVTVDRRVAPGFEGFTAAEEVVKKLKIFVNSIDFLVKANQFWNNRSLENYGYVLHAGISTIAKYRDVSGGMRSGIGLFAMHSIEITGALIDVYKCYKVLNTTSPTGGEASFAFLSLFGNFLVLSGEGASIVGAIEIGLPLILIGKGIVLVGDLGQIFIPNPSEFELLIRLGIFGNDSHSTASDFLGNVGIQTARLNKFLYPLRAYNGFSNGSLYLPLKNGGYTSRTLSSNTQVASYIIPTRFPEMVFAVKLYDTNGGILNSYLIPVRFSDHMIHAYFSGTITNFIPNTHPNSQGRRSANLYLTINGNVNNRGDNIVFIEFQNIQHPIGRIETVMTLGELPERITSRDEQSQIEEIFNHYPFTTRNF